MELKVIECGRTSLDFELALTGHPDRPVTATGSGRKELLVIRSTSGVFATTPDLDLHKGPGKGFTFDRQ